MRTIGENIHKTAFTFSARKKKKFSISENFFRKWVKVKDKNAQILPLIL